MKYPALGIVPIHGPLTPVEGPAPFVQFQVLRDGAEAELDALLRAHADHPGLLQVQQASRDLSRALQAVCLDLRREAPEDIKALERALENQLLYLQACLRRSFSDY